MDTPNTNHEKQNTQNEEASEKNYRYLLRVVLYRLAIVAVLAISAYLVYLLLPFLPKGEPPAPYMVGTVEIPSFAQVVEGSKLMDSVQELSGEGRLLEGEYIYSFSDDPSVAAETYTKELLDKLTNATVNDAGEIVIASDIEGSSIVIKIEPQEEHCYIKVSELGNGNLAGDVVDDGSDKGFLLTAEEAYSKYLLTLTKEQTGFLADISVYTVNTATETVEYDGGHYYVFTIVADYEDGRPVEYRGTFYVGCNDGVIFRHNLETGENTRLA